MLGHQGHYGAGAGLVIGDSESGILTILSGTNYQLSAVYFGDSVSL